MQKIKTAFLLMVILSIYILPQEIIKGNFPGKVEKISDSFGTESFDIINVRWENKIDEDDDDYTRKRTLEIYVSNSSSAFIYFKIDYKKFDNSATTVYYENPGGNILLSPGSWLFTFEDFGDASWGEFDHYKYDFRVFIKNWPDGATLAHIGPNDPDLDNERFETAAQDETSDLFVSPTSLSFNYTSGSQTVSVTSNVSWSVTPSQSWISVSPTSGSNNGSVSVSVTENPSTTSSRSGTVTVSGGGITRTVSVSQSPAPDPDHLTVSPTSLSFGYSGGSQSVSVTSNVSWSATPSQSWITVNPTSGSNDGSVNVSVTENPSTTSSRSGTVTVSGGGITRTVSVSQSPAPDPDHLTVSPTSLSFGYSGGSQSVSVTSNVSWSATPSQSWITVNPTSGSNDGSVNVSVTENPSTTSSRSGTVTVSGGGITRTVSVSQGGIDGTIVWPGDANNDGQVNAADVLPLGLFYGLTGPSRSPGGCTWEAQTCPSGWSPPNAAYADCNGDGIVNAADVICIGFNYGKTHSLDVMNKVVTPSSTNDETKTKPQVGFNFYNEYGTITSLSEINDGDIFYLGLKLNSPEKLLGTAMEVGWSGADMRLLNLDGSNGLTVSNAWSEQAISMIHNVEDENRLALGITDVLNREKEGNIEIGRIKMIMESKGEVTIEVAEAMGMNKLGEYVKINGSKIEKGIESTGNQATEYRLSNYPNPFNPTTRIRFSIPTEEVVSLRIYNSLGEEVAELVNSEKMGAGEYEYSWDASQLSSGIYFYSLHTSNNNQIKKMLLIK